MKLNLTASLLLLSSSLFLAACGSSSSNDTASVRTGTAQYVDSSVEGVTVDCGTSTSVTNAQGEFTFAYDQECTFSIGSIVLRTETGITENQIIVEDNIIAAQFLQSMDLDGDASNGITIHPQTAQIMIQNNISKIPTSDQLLAAAVEAMDLAGIGFFGHFVNMFDAWTHLIETFIRYGLPIPSYPYPRS